MKIVIRKLRCPTCQKLVRGHAQKMNSQLKVLCSACGNPLRLWTGTSWRILRESD
ncbi:MAG: hypothetical protein HYX84_01905 [Chloroflexi bacterium]|nr:hypothetical protein [Chloroflexota bacterium]